MGLDPISPTSGPELNPRFGWLTNCTTESPLEGVLIKQLHLSIKSHTKKGVQSSLSATIYPKLVFTLSKSFAPSFIQKALTKGCVKDLDIMLGDLKVRRAVDQRVHHKGVHRCEE